ncbi:ketopantoate reductase [Granulicella rosea]|uniref:2-dehydropantoate 2-reductase n=1 Tax=Granulicella rosea TaxID=474952 RepID=A0A239D6A0_9BACT|nr:2-dehydropantoate 2-reductase [Granulicella rosea]SNS27391.1 ketopantoate reductase [Granulicella rosea]
MAKVAIIGVGAIGGVLAGLLQAAGAHEITLCTRRPLPSLVVETPDGNVTVQAKNLTQPEPALQDWVFVATKTYDAAGAAAWFPSLVGPETKVAIVQNGVEHRENFAAWLAPEQIVPVVIDVPAERLTYDRVLQRSDAVMRVQNDVAGSAFAGLFQGSRARVELTDDFLTAAWSKLVINAMGVVSALTLKPAGVLRDEALGPVALAIGAECIAVGRAAGAKLDDSLAERVLAGARAGSPDSINSLLADRIAGRPTEIAARNGVIVRLGQLHGVPTPANAMAVALFLAMTS